MYTLSLNLLRIMAAPQSSLSIPDTGFNLITFLTHEVFSISEMFVSFTILGGHCLYNSSLLMYFPILGSELITASCKNYLIVKRPWASRNFLPRKINRSSWFSFSTRIVSCYFPISIPHLLYWITTRCVSHYSL